MHATAISLVISNYKGNSNVVFNRYLLSQAKVTDSEFIKHLFYILESLFLRLNNEMKSLSSYDGVVVCLSAELKR